MAYTTVNNTGTSVSAQSSGAVRKLWQAGVDMHEQMGDFFQSLEGRGNSACIQTITDTSKGKGQTITFTQLAGLYDIPHHGDELFDSGDDFEEIVINSQSLSVDYIRHGLRFTERMEEYMGMRGELAIGLPEELGKWLGRQKAEKMAMMFLHKGGSANTIYANNKADRDSLVSADVLDWDNIVTMGVQLERLGGRPAMVGRDKNGNEINSYIVAATHEALYSLEVDTDYKNMLEAADSRGAGNLLWKGGYHDIRGNVIKKWRVIDHDGHGPIGSPMNPKGQLGAAIAAGTGALTITLGGSAAAAAKTNKEFARWFPNHDYVFQAGDTLTPTYTTFYVLVIGAPNATNNPNKIGFYKISANDGNDLTVSERLSPVTAGIGKQTVGSVTYGTAPWTSDVVTDGIQDIGSTVILANAKGVPIGWSLDMGAHCARRGYGKWRNRRGVDGEEAGFIKELYISSVFGQSPRMDTAGRYPGYLVMWHAVNYAGLPIPTVTS